MEAGPLRRRLLSEKMWILTSTPMSPLHQRMIEDMTIRNLSPATQQSYIYAIAKFSGISAARRIG